MNVGIKIKKILLDIGQSQKWLSVQTGIDYDALNASLNGHRTLQYDELATILWATGANASDVIAPTSPQNTYVS